MNAISTTPYPDARIFIVDDEEMNILLLEEILSRAGYTNFRSTRDPRAILEWVREEEPELILLDLAMPGFSGFDVMEHLDSALPQGTYLPILVVTAHAIPEMRNRAFGSRATDFLGKPLDRVEVLLRIRNLLHTRYLHHNLANYAQELEEIVEERTRSLREALAELEAAQKYLVQQERLKAFGMMASGVTHDFNNVLEITLGYAKMLLDEGCELSVEDRIKCAKAIVTASQDGSQMVERLRDFYRPRGDESWEPVNLNDVAAQAIGLSEPKWKERAQREGTQIEVRTEQRPVPFITGNAAELRAMLVNLIFNSVDALKRGGIIQIRTAVDNGEVVLEISDTGCGMTHEVRERCLEPFFTTKGERGTGMGLAMVYGAVQRHQARLELESECGRGTTFRFRFPQAQERITRSEIQASC